MSSVRHLHRSRRRASTIASVLVVAALTAATAACAEDASTDTPDTTVTTAGAATIETATPAKATVTIADRALSNDEVVIRTGGTVSWVNSDTVDHWIVSLDSDVIRSPVLGQGGSYTALFTMPGEYPYYCNIYNFMKGTVVVR